MPDFKKTLTVGVATFGLVASLGVAPAVAADTNRLAGGDRIGTAVEVAAHAFAGQKPAVVYVAGSSNRNLVDATTAGKLADGPLLYAPGDSGSAAELGQNLAKNPIFSAVKRVVAVGGNASVHEGIVKSLASSLKTTQVSRLSGADRYETSVAIAKHALAQAKAGNKAYATMLGKGGQTRAVYLANGGDNHLVDSMVAGTLGDGPTILTRPDGTLPETAKALLAEAKPANVTGLGGSSAISDAAVHQAATIAGTKNVSRLGGADRFATAAQIAARYTQVYGAPAEVYVAGSGAAPDAIIGGQLKRGPILLVAPNGTTPTATSQALQAINKASGGKTKILGLGGKNTLPDQALKTATNPGTPTKPTEKKPQPTTSPSSPSSSSGGYSGGSSSSGSSSSASGSGSSSGSSTPSRPEPELKVSAAGDKYTADASKSESIELTVKLGDSVATAATFEGMTPADAGDGAPNVTAKHGSSGTFTVATLPQTKAGKYKLKFKAAGKTVEKEITVQKPHTTLAALKPVDTYKDTAENSAKLPIGSSATINIAEFGTQGETWNKITQEFQEEYGRAPHGSDFEVRLTGEGSFNPEHAGIINAGTNIATFQSAGKGVVQVKIPDKNELIGKSFTIEVLVVGEAGKQGKIYLPSQPTNKVTVRITAKS